MIVEYQALDRTGTLLSDTIVVEPEVDVCAELKRRGLVPVHIGRGSAGSVVGGSGLKSSFNGLLDGFSRSGGANPRRASKRHVQFFTSQLAILLETGTPVASSLSSIEHQLTCPHWKVLVGNIRRHVEEGGTLASSVGRYPKLFDPLFTSMIAAGESSGRLPEILNRLAELARQSDRIRSKVISTMIYPALLMTIASSVLAVLLFFVLPRFGAIFEEMSVVLPSSTSFMLSASEFVRGHVFLSLLCFCFVIGGPIFWLYTPSGRRVASRFLLRVPVIGPLVSSIINARIFRLVGLLVESSIPLLEALDLTTSATKHYLYVAMLERVHSNVLNGRAMSEAMASSGLVPASLSAMVRTGEENGNVGKVMLMLADYLDDNNDTKVGMLTSIMEPVILIFMGLIVGVVAVSLVLPMFDLSRISG